MDYCSGYDYAYDRGAPIVRAERCRQWVSRGKRSFDSSAKYFDRTQHFIERWRSRTAFLAFFQLDDDDECSSRANAGLEHVAAYCCSRYRVSDPRDRAGARSFFEAVRQ
jgi:hypothetical protein